MALNEQAENLDFNSVSTVSREINHSELNVALSEKVIELNDLRRDLVDALKLADYALASAGFQDVQPVRKAVRAAIDKGIGAAS